MSKTVILIDDNFGAFSYLKEELNERNDVKEVLQFSDFNKIIKFLEENNNFNFFDLIFISNSCVKGNNNFNFENENSDFEFDIEVQFGSGIMFYDFYLSENHRNSKIILFTTNSNFSPKDVNLKNKENHHFLNFSNGELFIKMDEILLEKI